MERDTFYITNDAKLTFQNKGNSSYTVASWFSPSEGTGKRGHIVAHDVSWAYKSAGHKMNVVFPCCANWETFVADTKLVSATNVARAGKRGNICVGNHVSATMCPRLPGP